MRHAKRAESLIETIVAITVIVLATTTALSIMRVALRGNQVVEKKVTAINLALEVFEGLKNVRDTNYLRFATDPDKCWNKYNVNDVADCSDGTADELLEGLTYYLKRRVSGEPLLAWSIEEATTGQHYAVNFHDVDLDLDGVTDFQMFTQGLISDPHFILQTSNSALFERSFEIVYGDEDGNGTDDYYDAIVTVTWEENGAAHELELTRSIAHVY